MEEVRLGHSLRAQEGKSLTQARVRSGSEAHPVRFVPIEDHKVETFVQETEGESYYALDPACLGTGRVGESDFEQVLGRMRRLQFENGFPLAQEIVDLRRDHQRGEEVHTFCRICNFPGRLVRPTNYISNARVL